MPRLDPIQKIQKLRDQGKLDQALKLIKKTVKKADLESQLKLWQMAGFIHLLQGDKEKCYQYCQDVLKEAKKQGFKEIQADCLACLGNYHHLEDKLKTAKKYYQRALRLAKKIKHKRRVGTVTINLATIDFQEKKYTEAEKDLRKVLTGWHDDHKVYVNALIQMGKLNSLTGDFEKSLELLELALKLAKRYKLVNEQGDVYKEIARAYEYHAAKNYQAAAKIFKKGGFKEKAKAMEEEAESFS